MKTVKSLLLGMAAGLLAMSGASAATLSDKAKPVHFVQASGYLSPSTYFKTAKHLSVGAVYGMSDILKTHALGQSNPGHTALPAVAKYTVAPQLGDGGTLLDLPAS